MNGESLVASLLKRKCYILFLGDNSEMFGKQKCWSSIGWGTFSILIGWLVDVVSLNEPEKNYSPIFYSSLIITTLEFFVMTKIEVSYQFKIILSGRFRGKGKFDFHPKMQGRCHTFLKGTL